MNKLAFCFFVFVRFFFFFATCDAKSALTLQLLQPRSHFHILYSSHYYGALQRYKQGSGHPVDRCSTIAAIKTVGVVPAAQTGDAAALYVGGALSEMSGGSLQLCRRRLPIVVSAS